MNYQNHNSLSPIAIFDCSLLIRIRNFRNWSQQNVADYLEVHQSKINRWEAGSSIPDANEIKALAGIFEVDINYFFSNKSTPHEN